MTTVPAVSQDAIEVGPPDALATAELRRALGELGNPTPAAAVRFEPDGDQVRVVVEIPPTVPWRIADAAVMRMLRQVRAEHPDVRCSGRRFEDCSVADG